MTFTQDELEKIKTKIRIVTHVTLGVNRQKMRQDGVQEGRFPINQVPLDHEGVVYNYNIRNAGKSISVRFSLRIVPLGIHIPADDCRWHYQ